MYFVEQFIEIGWTFIKASAVLIFSLILLDFWRRVVTMLFNKSKGTKFTSEKNDRAKQPVDFFSIRKGGRNDPPSGERPSKPTGSGEKPDKNTH